MRVVFAGTPAAAVPSLEALLDSRHEVVAVLTRPDAPAGRGRRLTGSAVAERARAAGVELLQPERAKDPALHDALARLQPDCCPVVAYGALVPRALLDLPAHGWVNLHFSLLPAWRGAAPVQHAVLAGDEVTGATAFRLEEGLDTGPVLGTMTTAVGARETSGQLLERLARDGAGLLVGVLDALEEGRLDAVPQPADGVSHAPKLLPADARVDWTAPARRVDRLVRACTPEPGAWTTLRGERLGLGPVEPVDDGPSLAPGELHVAARAVLAGTGTGPVRLGEVRPAGRRAMAAPDWARGTRPAPDERLGG